MLCRFEGVRKESAEVDRRTRRWKLELVGSVILRFVLNKPLLPQNA